MLRKWGIKLKKKEIRKFIMMRQNSALASELKENVLYLQKPFL